MVQCAYNFRVQGSHIGKRQPRQLTILGGINLLDLHLHLTYIGVP